MKKVCFVLSCLLVLAMVSNADLVTINDLKVDEAQLDGNPTYSTRNNGASTLLGIGNATSETLDIVALLRFDVSEIPVGSVINSVTLNVQFRDAAYNYAMVDIFKISAANAGWIEGVGTGGLSNPGECSWDYKNFDASNPVAWAGSGGLSTPVTDYDPTALATVKSFDPAIESSYGPRSISLGTSAVQDWVNNPAGNAGMLLKNQAGYELKRAYMVASEFVAGEYSREPTLIIDYTLVPEPMTVVLLGLGGLLIRKKR